jgi:hypothetical protein
MTSSEYWLLDSVVEQRHPLSLLAMENVDAILDRPSHGMERGALIEQLAQLFGAGVLIATNETRGEFAPMPDEIAAVFEGALDADYGLTAKGGQLWEEVSSPDWNRFVDGVFGESNEAGEFEGTNHERVGEFVCADLENLLRFIESLPFKGIAPHPPSLKWDELRPWQALYWKQLPSGHRARFLGVSTAPWPEEQIPEKFRDLGMWYTPLV